MAALCVRKAPKDFNRTLFLPMTATIGYAMTGLDLPRKFPQLTPLKRKKAASTEPIQTSRNNFHITDDNLGAGGAKPSTL